MSNFVFGTYKLATAVFFCISCNALADEFFKCTGPDGSVMITHSGADPKARLNKNCKQTNVGQSPTTPLPPKSRLVGASANPSPVGFPRVQEDTQKARDGDRRHILEQEMSGEQRNLEQAKKDLAEQEAIRGAPNDRVVPYRERVGQHERNIQAIQKELNNLR